MSTKTIDDQVRSLELFVYRTGEDLADIKTTLAGHTGRLDEIRDRLTHIEKGFPSFSATTASSAPERRPRKVRGRRSERPGRRRDARRLPTA